MSDIACPCGKPNCPFREDGSRKGGWKSRNSKYMMTSGVNDYLSSSTRHSVATYLASLHPAHGPVAINTLQHHRQDCQVTEEPLARHGEVYFIRNSVSRRAQRRHSTIRVSASYPVTMNSLMVPTSLNIRGERSHSLPNIYDCPLGSSLDSLDSDKMHGIQKSFLRAQQRLRSQLDLVQL